MNLAVVAAGGGILAVAGHLDIESASELRISLVEALSQHPAVILDLRSIERCDVAGLQILLAAQNTSIASSKEFRLRAPSPVVIEAASAAGVVLPPVEQ